MQAPLSHLVGGLASNTLGVTSSMQFGLSLAQLSFNSIWFSLVWSSFGLVQLSLVESYLLLVLVLFVRMTP